MKSKGAAFLLLLLILATAQGCKGFDLELLAKTLGGIATANKTMLEVVLTAENNGLISDDEARPFVDASLKIGLAGREAVAITKKIAEMDESARGDLFQILDPILEAVDNIVESEDLSGIKDEETQASLRLALAAIRTTILTARIMLEE